jgi:hypothetical protein
MSPSFLVVLLTAVSSSLQNSDGMIPSALQARAATEADAAMPWTGNLLFQPFMA